MAPAPAPEKKIQVTVSPLGEGMRIDAYLATHPEVFSRSRAARLIEEGRVLLDGEFPAKDHKLKEGSRISIGLPATKEWKLEPAEVPFGLVYEDDDLAVVSKPPGLVVHPAPGNFDNTLVHGLLSRLDLSTMGGKERPGIVHRLDKDTSGLMLVAKNDLAHNRLSAALKKRDIRREYLALVRGEMRGSGTVDKPIGRHPVNRKKMAVNAKGRPAVTHWKALRLLNGHTLLSLKLETGRTHQIRVHLASIGHPIAGDLLYGGKDTALQLKGLDRQFLHAARLELVHPISGSKLVFEEQLPPDLDSVLQAMAGGAPKSR